METHWYKWNNFIMQQNQFNRQHFSFRDHVRVPKGKVADSFTCLLQTKHNLETSIRYFRINLITLMSLLPNCSTVRSPKIDYVNRR